MIAILRQKYGKLTLSLLCGCSTDASATEQDVTYIVFSDPNVLKPMLSFFEVAALDDSQDVTGLKNAIIGTIKHLNSVLNKIAFLSSDGANVNCGKESGLIALIQEEHPWVVFIWCFSHKLEVALKYSLK